MQQLLDTLASQCHAWSHCNMSPTVTYTAIATAKGSERAKWSLHVHIPNGHKSTIVVDASDLRHCQPKQAKGLANVAMDAVRNNRSTCSAWGANAQFPCCSSNSTRPNPIDRELQQVLEQVKNTREDELQFKAWKWSIESRYHCQIPR